MAIERRVRVVGRVLGALALASCGGKAAPVAPTDGGSTPTPGQEGGVRDTAARLDTTGAGSDLGVAPADTGGGTPVDGGAIFAGCPGPEAYAGDPAWKDTLAIAAPGPTFCARWVETPGTLDRNSTANQLKQSLAQKAMATIAPGSYRLVDGPGPAAITLPLCLVETDRKPRAIGAGTVKRRMQGPASIFDLSFPVAGTGPLRGTLVWEGGSPVAVKGLYALDHCLDPTCAIGKVAYLSGCDDGSDPVTNVVVLDSGTVELHLTIGRGAGAGAGTEPATFLRASGTFRGTAFEQRDYFKLVYSPEHHHFVRNFAVLFDAPIDGACGIEIANFPGPPTTRPIRAWAVGCQLDRLTEIAVKSVK